MMTTHPAYDALGVPASATHDEVKRAYRALVLKHHPDRNPGDPGAAARLQRVVHAYEHITKGRPFGDATAVYADGFGGAADPSAAGAGTDYEVEQVVSLEEAYSGAIVTLDPARFAGVACAVRLPVGAVDGCVLLVRPVPNGVVVRVRVRIAPHPVYDLDGNDLALEVEVPAKLLGTEFAIEVPLPDGTTVRVEVPDWLDAGDAVFVPKLGLVLPPVGRGDLHVFLRAAKPARARR